MFNFKPIFTISKITLLFSLFLFYFTKISAAKVVFPSIIGNGMVLQQKAESPLWGYSKPDQKITIITSWDKKKYQHTADKEGFFKVFVDTPSAGGPYQVNFNDGEETVLSDVYIGEVWVCSGQSNMEMPVKGFSNDPVLNSEQEIANSTNKNIHLFRVDRYSSPNQRLSSTGKWQHANPESVSSFSAVGYFYAKILQQELNIPIGIIETAWGGTRIESWMSEKSLSAFPKVKLVSKEKMLEGNKKVLRNNPTGLFNGMVKPILGYGIKGVIWYQGESNRLEPLVYANLFPAMVKDWREQWGQGNWPFYYVQIAPYSYPKDENKNQMMVPLMREVQLNAMNKISNSGVVISLDAGSESTIHPPDKQIIARRLANWALANDYKKKDIAFLSPIYKSHEINDEKVFMKFQHAEKGLKARRKVLADFEIAGEDKKFYPAKAIITDYGVEVSSSKVKKPLAVRYAFKRWAKGGLYALNGLPVAPFRTDNWDL